MKEFVKKIVTNKYVRFIAWYTLSMGGTLGCMFGIMEGLQKIPYFDFTKELK